MVPQDENRAPGAAIAVVIPCYKVTRHILGVLAAIGPEVSEIYCVDDGCPHGSGDFIREHCTDPRVTVLRNPVNMGVGGAMVTGYRHALTRPVDIVVKIDGDGQMDPRLIPQFVAPILSGECDYTKGNRFFNPDDVRAMPRVRLIGNAGLAFLCKLSSGYWDIFDPTNGYTAIHAAALAHLPLDKIARRFFFESDMLFRLNILRARVIDVPMEAVYGDEVSNLSIRDALFKFMGGHARNFAKRIFYNYFLRDFHVATVELVLGLILVPWGVAFGLWHWALSAMTNVPASAGTVMLSALPIILGTQLLLACLNYDVSSVPRTAIHQRLRRNLGPAAVEAGRAADPVTSP